MTKRSRPSAACCRFCRWPSLCVDRQYLARWPFDRGATGALQSISKELYEAAAIDGANGWQVGRYSPAHPPRYGSRRDLG